MKAAIAGGGAAGFFAAIACKQENPSVEVTILEQNSTILSKVALSGGGRCNLSNSVTVPRQLSTFYPRGSRELIGPFTRFGPADTVKWFQSHGVTLKTEPDGRVFPASDKSLSIVNCLSETAENSGVILRKSCGIEAAIPLPDLQGFELILSSGSKEQYDMLLLATGGSAESAGISIASSLGHTIIEQVPSLFSFVVNDRRIAGIPGISLPEIKISIPETRFSSRGPALITHNGLSGPAVLKLSSFAARDLFEKGYDFQCMIDWYPHSVTEQTIQQISLMRTSNAGKRIHAETPIPIPKRLWVSLAEASGCGPTDLWAHLSKKQALDLTEQIHRGILNVTGKDRNKEEFVTCGGVKLSEINFKTMQSKIHPRLFAAGELLDIDGLTGGFNLQAAWTTGYIAGLSMASLASE